MLSQTEFQLLYLFAEHPGKILDREFLLEKIWSYHTESKSRTIDNFIVRLRRKLQAHQKSKEQGYPRIEAVYGRGYRFLI